jgi:hypothetical protein
MEVQPAECPTSVADPVLIERRRATTCRVRRELRVAFQLNAMRTRNEQLLASGRDYFQLSAIVSLLLLAAVHLSFPTGCDTTYRHFCKDVRLYVCTNTTYVRPNGSRLRQFFPPVFSESLYELQATM